MKKYIEAKDLRDRIFAMYRTMEQHPDSEGVTEDLILKAIDRTPPADVTPVIHARWTETNYNPYIVGFCSNCGRAPVKQSEAAFDYCPRCGAKMDGEAKT